jgi:nicotinamidase-related amidase
MTKHILDIVDMQFDFTKKSGKLPVPWADPLNGKTNEFFGTIPKGVFDAAIFKYDTHFSSEYPHSPESKSFPNIHCEHGTPGWDLTVDAGLLKGKMPVWYMSKNVFDMWDKNPVTDQSKLKFNNDNEAKAYANLFHVTDDPKAIQRGVQRDEFFRAMGLASGEDFFVTMLGVASDICVHDAALGYLQHGAQVRIIEDLVTGIGTPVQGRAYSGHINDVLALPVFSSYVKSQQLTLISARQVHEKFEKIRP